jgi:hypothetical protein
MSRWSVIAVVLIGCGSDSGGSAIDAGPVDAAASPIRINEVMPANAMSTCVDELGGNADWVELYNPTDADIDLGGYSATDDVGVPLRTTIVPGVMVPAHGYKLLWCDDDTQQGGDHLGFKLGAAGESFALFDPGVTMVDSVTWPALADDAVYARIPDGTGAFTTCTRATCGASNGAACAAGAP